MSEIAKIITFVSGKGGVGKTVITANFGRELAKLEKKVLLIDMDIGLRNLDIVLGVEDRIMNDITDVLSELAELSATLVECPKFGGVVLLPASQTKTHEDILLNSFNTLLAKLRTKYDYILIDAPSGIGNGFRNCVSAADLAVIVATPDKCSVRDADKILLELEQIAGTAEKVTESVLLINRVGAKFLKPDRVDETKVAAQLGIEVLGIISEGKLTKDVKKIVEKI